MKEWYSNYAKETTQLYLNEKGELFSRYIDKDGDAGEWGRENRASYIITREDIDANLNSLFNPKVIESSKDIWEEYKNKFYSRINNGSYFYSTDMMLTIMNDMPFFLTKWIDDFVNQTEKRISNLLTTNHE